MCAWTTYDGTESPALKRYERTIDALSLCTASVRADGLSLADAFMRHLSDIDSDADIPAAATPPWRKFLADYAGVPDPAGVHLSDCCTTLATLPDHASAAALRLLEDTRAAAEKGLHDVEAQNAAAWSDALDTPDAVRMS